jgi:hypothetical protein
VPAEPEGPSLAPAVDAPKDPPVAPDEDTKPAETAEVGIVSKREVDPTIFPDPKKFSTGFFVEGSTGPMVPLGPTFEVLSPGFSLSARLGYEIRRWVALQLHGTGAVSKYDDGVIHDELLQQYFYTGEVRFGIPIRRFLIAFQGGAGLWQTNNNLLQIAGIADDNTLFGFAWDAGGGLDYHSLNRHFSAGILATFIGMPELQNAGSLTIHLYIRYVAGGGKKKSKSRRNG